MSGTRVSGTVSVDFILDLKSVSPEQLRSMNEFEQQDVVVADIFNSSQSMVETLQPETEKVEFVAAGAIP